MWHELLLTAEVVVGRCPVSGMTTRCDYEECGPDDEECAVSIEALAQPAIELALLRVVIVGAGVSGLVTAKTLHRAGIEVCTGARSDARWCRWC